MNIGNTGTSAVNKSSRNSDSKCSREICLPCGLNTCLFDSGGTKPVVVLVHGLANAVEIWEPLLEYLAVHFRIVAFDLAGFGEADRPDVDYGLDFFARQLDEVICMLDLWEVNLVGYSLGASIIVRYCTRYPQRINRIVLTAPGGFGRNTHWSMRLPSLPFIGGLFGKPTKFSTALTLRLAIKDTARITPELVATMNEHAAILGSWKSYLRTLREGVGLFGVKGRDMAIQTAATIDIPVMVIWGREDRVFPLNHSEKLMESLKNGRLTIFENCGHYPHWEYPEEFADVVKSHLMESAR